MRFLIKALLAATALIPVATAATAQDAPEREGRWRGNRGVGAEAKIEARNAARGNDAAGQQPQAQAQPEAQGQPRQQRWDGNRGAGVSARADASAEFRGQPRGEQSRPDQRQWNGRAEGRPPSAPALPQANVAVNRGNGSDWNNPRTDRARGAVRSDDRHGWNGQAERRDDRRFDTRNDGRSQARDDRRGNDRDRWNQPRRDDRYGNDGWNQPRSDDRFQNCGTWNRTWRDDRRYDWNGYRANNRSAYRLPHYYAPSGWSYGYRRFSIGATLSSLLWDENYWIEDPYSYRLPEVYGPYRWVRYYDDALLVDIRTGRVVDVVNGIFW